MLTALLVLLRSIGLIYRGHRAVALENLALRQQLAALTRTIKRPRLRRRDRLFWILLAKGWREWRTALMVVQPETVLRWHRQWLRRRWADRSKRIRPGSLVDEMAVTNPPMPNPFWRTTAIGEPSVADAICDRVIHRAHRLTLKGPTMRDPGTRRSPKGTA